jgi:hypothetical protein
MRSPSFDPQAIRKHLLRHKIATLPELKAALGTSAGLTVFRKLKLLDYLSSYTHRGRYYALREAARFDDAGLWSHDAVWFSRHGTLVSTIESFVNQSPRGWFADELADILHAEVQDPLHDLVRAGRLRRSEVAGRFLYTSADSSQARDPTPYQTDCPVGSLGSRCFRPSGFTRGTQSCYFALLQPAR